jgi:GAF domain/ANTAR domain
MRALTADEPAGVDGEVSGCDVVARTISRDRAPPFVRRRRPAPPRVVAVSVQNGAVAIADELVAREVPLEGDKPAGMGRLQRLCRAAARSLPASGVGVSVMSTSGEPVTAVGSDSRAELVEELQFTVGEGPCLDAFGLRRPVFCTDLEQDSHTVWPGYGPAAHRHGVRAVFAFPMQIGAARLGALDVYRDVTGVLPRATQVQALAFADVAMRTLLDAQQHSDEKPGVPPLDEGLDNQFSLYQAQGMVMVQLGVDLAEAMARLRAYAYATDRRLGDIAADVVARRLTLEEDIS